MSGDEMTRALERFYAAVNRFDLVAIVQDFDAQIVRVEPEGYETAGTYRGIDEVRACVAKGRGTWAEGRCNPENFLVKGDQVGVYLHARVRLKDAADWVDGRFADGFKFRGGKIARYQTFWERREALVWAGIEEPGAAEPASNTT